MFEKSFEKELAELSIRLESMDAEVDAFFGELNLSLERVSEFVRKRENFKDDRWVALLEQRSALEEKLKRELENIRNPSKTKKTYSGLRVQQHWIPLR